MKKYLGGSMGAYCAIMSIFIILFFVIFAIVILTPPIYTGQIILAIFLAIGAIIWGLFIHKYGLQLYSWGTFDENGVMVKSLYSKKCIEIEYEKCKSIGIGLYVHGVAGSNIGSKVKYIFFSYNEFNEQFRLNINQWQPNETRIKVGYSKKLYDYLLTVLPEEQASILKNDYETYVKPFSKK